MHLHRALLAGTLLAPAIAHAQVTYVDADPATNTTLADGTPMNLTATPANPEDYSIITSAVTNDGFWHLRTGYANDGQVMAAGSTTAVPAIKTTLGGFTEGDVVAVYVYLWGTSDSPWHLQAGLQSGSLTSTMTGTTNISSVDPATHFTNNPPVLVDEGNRDLREFSLGTKTIGASGTLEVFLTNETASSLRSWYDGIGYWIVSPTDDFDNDGLTNAEELSLPNPTDPYNADTDGDLFPDGVEVATDPTGASANDPATYPINPAGLFIDFSNSGNQTGPEHDPGYQPYLAGHENGASPDVDRSETFPVPGFAGSPDVTLSIAYTDPDPCPNAVKQMIGRNSTDTAAYVGNNLELVRDWIGIDARWANGGNGTDSPTVMTLSFSGIPAGIYQYRGYHHDTQHISAPIDIVRSDSTGSTPLGTFRMTSSEGDAESDYQATNPGVGTNPSELPSTIEFLFTSDGSDVVLTYSVTELAGNLFQSFVAINAIEITPAVDTDGDGIPDDVDLRPTIDDTDLSSDADGLTDLEEYHLGTLLDNADSDADGLDDDVETNTDTFNGASDTGSSPFNPDSDGDGFSDGEEVSAGTDPNDSTSFILTPPATADLVAEDGVWTWFNDERAIWHQGYLFSGYVTSDGYAGVTRYDPDTGVRNTMIIGTATSRQEDDHNNPSFTLLPDGNILALYAKHGSEPRFYKRTSLVNTPALETDWGSELQVAVPEGNTYNNTYRLGAESDRVYNFHRCINFNPTITISDDNGATWDDSIHFIDTGVNRNQRPYPKYTTNHSNRVDLIYTDGHPDRTPCSIYHMFYQGGNFNLTDGTLLKTFAEIEAGDPIDHDGDHPENTGGIPERGTVVYQYSADAYDVGEDLHDYLPTARAWTWDITYQGNGNPVCAFQVQLSNVTGSSGFQDDRIYYYYARWTGSAWEKKLVAQGGRPIYSSQRWYGGGMAIDPENPNVVYISSNAGAPFDLSFDGSATGDPGDPYLTATALNTDDRYEIYRGVTADGGQTFTWEAITADSDYDNLRPIVPENHDYDRHALWFYGNYITYTNYRTAVVGLFENVVTTPQITDIVVNGADVTLTWESAPGATYNIKGSLTLADGFPYPADTAVPSQGTSTTHMFTLPAPLAGEPRVFLRVER